MADLALVTAGELNVVEMLESFTLPLSESIALGESVRIDPTTGGFTKAKATDATEANAYGMLVSKDGAGAVGTAMRRGIVDGFNLASLSYAQRVYLSDTDGALADAVGTVTVSPGCVMPGDILSIGDSPDKLLALDYGAGGSGGGGGLIENRVLLTNLFDENAVDAFAFVADRAYAVVGFREIHSVVGGSGAVVRPRKITAAGTDAPGDAAGATVKELTAADIDLTATAKVAQTPALSATAADLLLAAGDKIALNFGGTLTGVVGALTTILEPR